MTPIDFGTDPELDTFSGFRSGYTYGPLGGTTTAAGTNGSLRALPFLVPIATTFDRIGAEITTTGEAGSVLRIGIYYDNGAGAPGALLLDAGTIDGTSVTYQTITISQLLYRGIWWLASCPQLGTVTPPSMRSLNVAGFGVGFNGSPGSTTPVSYSGTSTLTGGLPAAFGTPATQGNTPRVVLRAA